MYGRTTGSLSVRLFAPGQTARRIFYKNGDQGHEWNAAFVTLYSSVPYQVSYSLSYHIFVEIAIIILYCYLQYERPCCIGYIQTRAEGEN